MIVSVPLIGDFVFYACSRHALVPVAVGDMVVETYHHREDFDITVARIAAITGDQATLETVAEFNRGEWKFTSGAARRRRKMHKN